MAEVFLARTAGPGGFEKQVVLKRILPELAQDPRFAELFMEEARVSARLGHPNIVQIFDFGEADGSYFIAMEYVEGPSLRGILTAFKKKGWQVPLEITARIAITALEALAYAHEFKDPARGFGGIIHRDVTPENIIVSRAGGVKLVDFGIAKALSASGEARTTLRRGKHAYMSPEQIRGKLKLDGRVDLFAVGVVLYELITGERPFKGATELAVLQAVLFEEPTPLQKLRPEVPASLQEVVTRALQKDREARFRSAREMIVALERFLSEDGLQSVTGAELSGLARAALEGDGPPLSVGAAAIAAAASLASIPSPPPVAEEGPTEPGPQRAGPQDAVTVVAPPPSAAPAPPASPVSPPVRPRSPTANVPVAIAAAGASPGAPVPHGRTRTASASPAVSAPTSSSSSSSNAAPAAAASPSTPRTKTNGVQLPQLPAPPLPPPPERVGQAITQPLPPPLPPEALKGKNNDTVVAQSPFSETAVGVGAAATVRLAPPPSRERPTVLESVTEPARNNTGPWRWGVALSAALLVVLAAFVLLSG